MQNRSLGQTKYQYNLSLDSHILYNSTSISIFFIKGINLILIDQVSLKISLNLKKHHKYEQDLLDHI